MKSIHIEESGCKNGIYPHRGDSGCTDESYPHNRENCSIGNITSILKKILVT
jgi:hypothetical protein